MGDRANIYVHEGDRPGVYLYTHWSGTELPESVRQSLKRGEERWDDPPYLTRILFSGMVPLGDWDGLTGYGISTVLGDGDDRIVDVDTEAQVVTLRERYGRENVKPFTFAEYTKPGRVLWPSEGGKRYPMPAPSDGGVRRAEKPAGINWSDPEQHEADIAAVRASRGLPPEFPSGRRPV